MLARASRPDIDMANLDAAGARVRAGLSVGLPLGLLAGIWSCPQPTGLSPQAWHMFAIFAATIAGILTQPLPSGAVMILALCLSIFTKTLTEPQALAGFASPTVWLIFSAYVLSLGFVRSGLGTRIACWMLSRFGGSSLGIAYALGVTDLAMAPAMPSVTARSGGVVFPLARAINEVLESGPGPSGRRIGDFLIMACFQFTPITGALFMTGMAGNPLAASLARSAFHIELSWVGWFVAASVPGLACFLIMPLVAYRLIRPELTRTPEAKVMGRERLAVLGPLSSVEARVAVGFGLALAGWGTSLLTGWSATTVGLGLVAYLFVSGAVDWKDVLGDRAAWDTVIWFSAIISLAAGLSDLGFVKWMTGVLSTSLVGWSWLVTFVVLGLAYIYVHYAFATASGHVAALYVPFGAAAIAAGAPPMMVAIGFGIFSNLMWGNTEYGGGPGPIYFAQGHFERPRFYAINLAIVTTNVAITFVVGLAWWKLLGYW